MDKPLGRERLLGGMLGSTGRSSRPSSGDQEAMNSEIATDGTDNSLAPCSKFGAQ